jgi:hypothetical protein
VNIASAIAAVAQASLVERAQSRRRTCIVCSLLLFVRERRCYAVHHAYGSGRQRIPRTAAARVEKSAVASAGASPPNDKADVTRLLHLRDVNIHATARCPCLACSVNDKMPSLVQIERDRTSRRETNMTHQPFDPAKAAPTHAGATGIEWTMRSGSRCMLRRVVATHSLA